MKKIFYFLGLCLVLMISGCSVYDKLIQNGRWIYTEEVPISEKITATAKFSLRFPTKEIVEVDYGLLGPEETDEYGNVRSPYIEYWSDFHGNYSINGDEMTLSYYKDDEKVTETYTFEVDKEKLVLTDNAGKSTTFIYEERVENPPR